MQTLFIAIYVIAYIILLNYCNIVLLLIVNLQNKYIVTILLSTFTNLAIYELKQYLNNQQQYNQNLVNKIYSIRYLVESVSIFASLFYIICNIYYVLNLTNVVIGLLYMISYYYLQQYILKIRKRAWDYTEKASEYMINVLNNKDLIQQNFESTNSAPFKEEMNKWNYYYIINSTLFCFYYTTSYLIFHYFNYNFKIYYALVDITNKTKVIFATYQDVNDILNLKKIETNNLKSNGSDIVFNNVSIQTKDIYCKPINLTIKDEIVFIFGNNATGKTLFCKAIANLISYSGQITKPNTLYLNNSSYDKQNLNLSQGERNMFLIDQAIEKKYELLILDEMLDVITCDKIIAIINKIKVNKMKLIVITHNENYLKYAQLILFFSNNIEIEAKQQ